MHCSRRPTFWHELSATTGALILIACSGQTSTAPPPTVTFNLLAAGVWHTCGLTPAGQAFCWGLGDNGRLGSGDTVTRTSPTPVKGGLVFTAITAGGNHSCGLTAAGTAYCWGYNYSGELGTGDRLPRLVPTAVTGGHTFTTVSAGDDFTCGLTAAGAAYCWGHNGAADLGVDTIDFDPHPTPLLVVDSLNLTTIATGSHHTCAIGSGGAAYCWGSGAFGEIGNGHTSPGLVPTAVTGGLAFLSIGAGDNHSCGLTTGGAAYCWGTDQSGELGNGQAGEFVIDSMPVPVSGGLAFTQLGLNGLHSCAMTSNENLYCWGGDVHGELGHGTIGTDSVPRLVSGGLSWRSVRLGFLHTCALTTASVAFCWGLNSQAELGIGVIGPDQKVPMRVADQP
jgi:alpha-tubulin suppressor-like RCC1 family protein